MHLTLIYTLTVLSVCMALLFFVSFFRAARFAKRHETQFSDTLDRASWWLRLFEVNGYGPDVEPQRRLLAVLWLGSGAAFFILGAIVILLAPAP